MWWGWYVMYVKDSTGHREVVRQTTASRIIIILFCMFQLSTMRLYTFMVRKMKLKKKILKNWYVECFLFHFCQLGIWNTFTDCSLKYILLFENTVRVFLLRGASLLKGKDWNAHAFKFWRQYIYSQVKVFMALKSNSSGVFHTCTHTKVCWNSFC